MKKSRFESLEELICIVFLLLMFVAISVNIILNWVISKRFAQLEELGTASYMFCTYAGFGLLYQRRELTSVSFVTDRLKGWAKWIAEAVRLLFLCFFGAVNTYAGVMLCKGSIVKKLPSLKIPYIFLNVCLVFGFGVLTICCLIDFFRLLKSAKQVGGGVEK